MIRIDLFNTAAGKWFTFHALHRLARFALEYFLLKLSFRMFPQILNVLQWNQHFVAANLTYIFVIYWNNKKKMAAVIWICKIEEKYKIRWQTIEKLGQKFKDERQLNAGTNPVHAKARNNKTGLQHLKCMDGIVTSNWGPIWCNNIGDPSETTLETHLM